MQFPIVIHKDPDSDYGVTVPDLPGCFSAGSTVAQAIVMAAEAIELHLEGLIEEGLPVPRPSGIEEHRGNPDYRDGTWAVVTVDAACLRRPAKRINVTMPERLLDAIDRFAADTGETRSGLLALAATDYIQRQRTAATTRRRPARGSARATQERR